MKKEVKAVAVTKTFEELREAIRRSTTSIDPDVVLKEADKEIQNSKGSTLKFSPETNFFKAMSLFEFENGVLMTTAIDERYRSFGLNMLRQIIKEYGCESVSEKATAELVVVSYTRTLEIQRRITSYLSLGTINPLGIGFLGVLSKELDRANRHYLTALQVLRTIKEQPLNVTLKATTAIIGQNQIVQSNNNENIKPK